MRKLKLVITAALALVIAHGYGTCSVATAASGVNSNVGGGRFAPVATVLSYAGSTAPAGWLLCNGAAVSRTTYAGLFGAIGTTYGAGDGSTTFNVPDARGRSIIGAGAGTGLTNRALGATGGAETHTLTSAEMPVHSHGVTDPGHTHALPRGGGAGEGPPYNAYYANNADMANAGIQSATTGISVNNAGSGSAHNNMSPFLALNCIIKH